MLGYTLLGLSIVKERFKEYKNDSGCYGYKQLEGVNNAEELVKKYLFEVKVIEDNSNNEGGEE